MSLITATGTTVPSGYTVSASDATSGVAECDEDGTFSGPDSASAGVGGDCVDGAGNVGSGSKEFKYDATGPTHVTVVADRDPDSAGWYNHEIAFKVEGKDAMSGIARCSTPSYNGADGTDLAVTGACIDKAGDGPEAKSSPLKYDATAPNLTPSVSPGPVVLNGPATASANASDATSGVASKTCDPIDTSSVGEKSVECQATDAAGNGAAKKATYSVVYATSGTCLGSPSHQILQPINTDWEADLACSSRELRCLRSSASAMPTRVDHRRARHEVPVNQTINLSTAHWLTRTSIRQLRTPSSAGARATSSGSSTSRRSH